MFAESGVRLPLDASQRIVSSQLVQVEGFRAIDRARLLGDIDDPTTAKKRKELTDVLSMLDLLPIDDRVIEKAQASFAVNVRTLDAIHVATAEVLQAAAQGEPLEFWTHDERQALAALSRGLEVRGTA